MSAPDPCIPAVEAAERFFAAVRARDHDGLWDLLSEGARAYVVNLAIERGMNFDAASRIRQGTAGEDERREYLVALLEGILHDLRGVDLQRLAYEPRVQPADHPRVHVEYLLPMEVAIGDVTPAIPAGSLVIVGEDGLWKVDHLVPRPGSRDGSHR